MTDNWNLRIKTTSDLEKDLMAKEVMRLRRQCKRLYGALRDLRTGIWDLYETPKKDLEESLDRWNTIANSTTCIIENIDKEQEF